MYRFLVKLCAWTTLDDLYSLVEELHLRRKEKGACLGDFEVQTQLRDLIYLVHTYGNLAKERGRADGNLLYLIKWASLRWRKIEPGDLMREVLGTLQPSWPELLAHFGVLAEKMETEKYRIDPYLYLNHLLYHYFLGRVAQLGKAQQAHGAFVISDAELRRILQRIPPWRGTMEKVPLLPLHSKKWLFSPELLYDALLESYVKHLRILEERGNKKRKEVKYQMD